MKLRHFATPAWLLCLASIVAILHATGSGTLALPSFTQDAFSEWASVTSPITITLAILRLVAYIVAIYLLTCATLAALAEALRSHILERVVRFISLPSVRQLNRRVVELSLIGMLAAPTAASASSVNDEIPVLRNLTPAPPVAPVIDLPKVETPAQDTWTVQHGENLWTIAETALQKRIGRAPTEAEIIPFWAALVQENQARLADVDNPDIIYIGQEFKLPR